MRSSKTGLKSQKKRRSPEVNEHATLCGWTVDTELLLWDDDAIEGLMFPSEEQVHDSEGSAGCRCPLLLALESELQEQEDAKKRLKHDPPQPLARPPDETSKTLSPSTRRDEEGRDVRRMEGEWGMKHSSHKKSAEAASPRSGQVDDLTEHREIAVKSDSDYSKRCKGHSAILPKIRYKKNESRDHITCPPPVAAIIYPDKKLESNLRDTRKKPSRNARKSEETRLLEKKLVNPSLISCSSEMNLKLDSTCAESMFGGEGKGLRKANSLKLPYVATSAKGLTCNGRSRGTKSRTDCPYDGKCQAPDANENAHHTAKHCRASEDEKGESTRQSTPQRTTVKKSSFEFDILEQYSVFRKTSREDLRKSSTGEQMSVQHDSYDVTIPIERSTLKELKDPGCSSTIKFPPLTPATCAHDTRTFHAVRALWCVLQRERLVVHVAQNAHGLSKGSRTLASGMIMRNRARSETGQEICEEDALPQGFRATKSQCPLQRIRDVTNKRLELQEDYGRVFPESVAGKMKCRNNAVLAPVRSAVCHPFDCLFPTWRDSERNEVSTETQQIPWPHS